MELDRDRWGGPLEMSDEWPKAITIELECPLGSLRVSHSDFDGIWVDGFFWSAEEAPDASSPWPVRVVERTGSPYK